MAPRNTPPAQERQERRRLRLKPGRGVGGGEPGPVAREACRIRFRQHPCLMSSSPRVTCAVLSAWSRPGVAARCYPGGQRCASGWAARGFLVHAGCRLADDKVSVEHPLDRGLVAVWPEAGQPRVHRARAWAVQPTSDPGSYRRQKGCHQSRPRRGPRALSNLPCSPPAMLPPPPSRRKRRCRAVAADLAGRLTMANSLASSTGSSADYDSLRPKCGGLERPAVAKKSQAGSTARSGPRT